MTKSTWWLATILQLLGVYLMALRWVDPPYCYMLMLGGSILGYVAASLDDSKPLVFLNLGFTVSNIIGIVRWL